jgi:hypothetical protein
MTSTFQKRSRVIYRQESFTTGTYYTGIMVYHRIMISAGSPPRISSNTLTPIHLHLVEAGVRSFQMVPKQQLHVITTILTKLTASNMKIKRIAKNKWLKLQISKISLVQSGNSSTEPIFIIFCFLKFPYISNI